MLLRSLFGLEAVITEAAVDVHDGRGPSRALLADVHDAIDEAVIVFILVELRHFNSSRIGCSLSLITLYYSSGTNHIYNFANTLPTQIDPPTEQAE